MIEFCLIGGKKTPGALSILQRGKKPVKDGFIHQQHHKAFAIPHIHRLPGTDHDVLQRFFIFKSIDDSRGKRADPYCLSARYAQDLCFHIFRKRVILRKIKKEAALRKCSEQAFVLPHKKHAVDSVVSCYFR